MLMETLAQDFALYLQAEKGYSPLTASSYCYDLRTFFDFIHGENVESEVGNVTVPLVRGWVVDMHRRGMSKSTIGRRLYGLRSFWSYLGESGVVDSDPVREVSVPKREQKLPKCLPAEALEELLEASQQSRSVFCAFHNCADANPCACVRHDGACWSPSRREREDRPVIEKRDRPHLRHSAQYP